MKSFLVRDVSGAKRKYTVWSDSTLQGWCDTPGDDEMTIYIDTALKGKAHLETAVHELMHALYPNWSERDIDHGASQIARFLWLMKYRRMT